MQMLLHLFVPKETQISRNVLEHVQQRYVNTAKKKKKIKTDRSAKHIIIAMAFVCGIYYILADNKFPFFLLPRINHFYTIIIFVLHIFHTQTNSPHWYTSNITYKPNTNILLLLFLLLLLILLSLFCNYRCNEVEKKCAAMAKHKSNWVKYENDDSCAVCVFVAAAAISFVPMRVCACVACEVKWLMLTQWQEIEANSITCHTATSIFCSFHIDDYIRSGFCSFALCINAIDSALSGIVTVGNSSRHFVSARGTGTKVISTNVEAISTQNNISQYLSCWIRRNNLLR